MEAKTIQKYKAKKIPALIAKAVLVFNAYIRKRDEGEPCISCGFPKELQAGHFYSGGHHACLRFNEFNVNGQCQKCNYFLHANLIPYRTNLVKKIGAKEVASLDDTAAYYRRTGWKWDRFALIDIIEKYKAKIKEL